MVGTMSKALNFVVAVILNEKDELLVLLRSSSAERDPNKWGICGGRLEAGEDPESGMLREIEEELGGVLELRLEARLGPLPAIGSAGGSVHLFRYKYASGLIHLNSEHTAFRWINQSDVAGLDLMPGVKADLIYFGIWTSANGPDSEIEP
jgi:8-oxo-dGTP diphosphatase